MLLCQTASHINADNAPRKLGQALASCGSVAGYSGMGMTSASLLAGKPTVCIAPGPENHRTASSVEPFSAGLLLNRHAGANLATLPTAVIDHPFQAWDFNPSTFAAGADSAIAERNGKSFTVYLQQAAAAGSTLVLNIAGHVGELRSPALLTTNSIALCEYSMQAKCLKRFKHNRKTSRKACHSKKYPSNWPIAVMERARSAIECKEFSTVSVYEVRI